MTARTKIISRFAAVAAACLIGMTACNKTQSYAILKNKYIPSEFVQNSTTNDHDRFFVARSEAEFNGWLNGKMIDGAALKEFATSDYSRQLIVVSVGRRLTAAQRVQGDMLVLTVAPQKLKGVGIAVVQGKTNVWVKFN